MRIRLVLAACLALVLVFTARWWLPSERPSVSLPERPDTRFDYTLSVFEARFTDAQGNTELIIHGPRLEHHSDTRIAVLTEPRFQIRPDGQAWHGQSRHGRFDRDADQLTLEDDVVLTQPSDDGDTVIETRILHHDRLGRTITATEAVEIRQPGTLLRAGGLKMELDTDIIELTDDVQATMAVSARAGGAAGQPRDDR